MNRKHLAERELYISTLMVSTQEPVSEK
jgi:hypothetical protein